MFMIRRGYLRKAWYSRNWVPATGKSSRGTNGYKRAKGHATPTFMIAVAVPTMFKPSSPANPPASNTLLLRRQLNELTKRPVEGFSAGINA